MQEYSNLINLTMCCLIGIAFLIFRISLIIPIKNLRKKLTFINNRLTLFKFNDETELAVFLKENFKNFATLAEIYTDFIEERSLNIIEYSGKTYSHIKHSDFFSAENISEKLLNLRMINSIPGIMTGLGILGTFIGLIIGISSIHITKGEILLNDIQSLLSGMNIAFLTSIVGIILGLYWILNEKRHYKNLLIEIEKFNINIEKYYPTIDLEHIIIKSMISNIKNNEILPQKFESVNKTLELTADRIIESQNKSFSLISSSINSGLKDEFLPEIKKAIDQSFEYTNKAMSFLTEFTATLDTLKDDLLRVSAEHKENAITVKTEIKAIMNSIKESFEITSKFRDFAKTLNATFEKATGNMNQTVNKMNEFSNKIVESADKFEAGLNQFSEKFLNGKQQVEINIKKLASEISILTNSFNDTFEKIKVEAVDFSGELDRIVHKAIFIFNKQLSCYEGLPNKIADVVANKINRAFDSNKLADSVKAISDELVIKFIGIKDMLKNATDSLGGSIANLGDTFEVYSQQMKSLPEDISIEISKKIQTAFDSSDNFKMFGEFKNSLNEFNNNFSAQVKEAARAIGGSVMSSVKDIESFLMKTNKIFGDFQRSINGIEDKMRETGEFLEKSAGLLGTNLSQSFNQTFSVFDEQLSKISMRLSGTITEIDSAVKDIPAVINEFQNALDSQIGLIQKEAVKNNNLKQ
ncbi:MAG: hypothetical protein BWY32_01663 [bacterium ADurb.Bin243]|nr:MAG: hypothetical protein BWY32_01663 [bacterium ADurb.Bin243]